MDTPTPPADFYTGLPIFRDFTEVMDPKLFTPLPDDWIVGVADVVQSTKAIAENRYKAVNMAGAAVISAIQNAVGRQALPYVVAGDGALVAVALADQEATRTAHAESLVFTAGVSRLGALNTTAFTVSGPKIVS